MLTRPLAHDAADNIGVSRRYAWAVFALLFALMVLDHVDRQIVVSLLPQLKGEWALSDTQLGGLVSINQNQRRVGKGPTQDHLPSCLMYQSGRRRAGSQFLTDADARSNRRRRRDSHA